MHAEGADEIALFLNGLGKPEDKLLFHGADTLKFRESILQTFQAA